MKKNKPEKEELKQAAATEKKAAAETVEKESPAEKAEDAVKEAAEAVKADTDAAGTEVAVKEPSAVDEPADNKPVEAPGYVPGKKKGRWKLIVFLLIVIAIVAFFVIRAILGSKAATPVQVLTVSKGSIEEIVSISGNIASAEKKSYFAPVAGPIETLTFKAGDRVKKGDLLYSYNGEELEKARKQAELALQQAEGTYSSSITKNAKATDVLRGNSIHDINNRLTQITGEIDALNAKITDKTNRVNQTLKDIAKTRMDINQNGIGDSYEAYFENGNDGWRTRTESGKTGDSLSEGDRQMLLALDQTAKEVQYQLDTDAEIRKWKDQITALNEEKATLTEQKTAEQSRLTGGDVESLKAQKELAELNNNATIEDIDEALAGSGAKADFAGVVTAVSTAEGATVNKGAQLITIDSTENVEVAFQIAKVDMGKVKVGQKVDITVNGREYEGEVSHISGTATKNSGGVPVVDAKIKIKNPDDQLILGVEATNKIHTNFSDNTIIVPYEYVGADADTDYVMVMEDGVAKRRDVTLGLTTSSEAEILSGLKEGDQLIIGDIDSLTDGMAVILAAEEAE